MKIAIINNLFSPFNRGGAETIVQRQVHDLTQQGHDVFIITTQPLFNKFKTTNNLLSKYKIYRFYPFNIFSFYNLNKLPLFLRAFWRLIDIFNLHSYYHIKKILNQEKPDVVYTHNLTGLGYLIPRLIKKLKIKNIHLIHDVALIRPSGLLISGHEAESILIKLYYKLTQWLFNSPDKVIFPSEWIKNYHLQHNFFINSKQEVIKNYDIKIKNLLQNKKLLQSNQINFLYIGQIESAKGILFLIKTFNELKTINYKLQVVGSGSQLEKVKKLAQNNQHIKFYGQQSNRQVKEILKQVDYLIVPSLCYENSPTVIFEALELNVPVIASDLGGIPELIQDNINGYLFEANNKQVFIQIINKILD